MRGARSRVAKRVTELHRLRDQKHGPIGERISADITTQIEHLSLASIKNDPTFKNLRLPPTREKLEFLAESMEREGLKIPIIVVPSIHSSGVYHVRAGFRRVAAARMLKWSKIPAIILAPDIPAITEQWINVIENSKDSLATYEIAKAAQTMRDQFGIKPREFAIKTGISEGYTYDFLRAIDRLPPELIEAWKEKKPIPIGALIRWSALHPDEAIRQCELYQNRHPKIVGTWRLPDRHALRKNKIKMASSLGMQRMQRLRTQIVFSPDLSETERALALQVADYCMGARTMVERVNDTPSKKLLREYRKKQREDLPQDEVMGETDVLKLEAEMLSYHNSKIEEETQRFHESLAKLGSTKTKG